MTRLFLFLITLSSYLSASSQSKVSHQLFNDILKSHVDGKGLVNYKRIKESEAKLDSYIKLIQSNPPQESWSKEEQLAFWINAYNAYTIKLVLEHYPIESIKDIGSKIQIPFVNTAWDIKFINIDGETYDLNNIEHGIIRKQFDEPRIHFALVCAAISCPKLQNEAYFPDKLDLQLTKAAEDFLNDPDKNEFKNSSKAKISKLFSWYGGDFTSKMSLAEYVSQYSKIKLDDNAKISFLDYDWSLNEQ